MTEHQAGRLRKAAEDLAAADGKTLSEAAKTLQRALHLGLGAMPLIGEALRAAADAEKTIHFGRRMGLTEDEAAEVLTAWTEWYQTTPHPVDHVRVRSAMTSRALNEEWRPTGN